MNLFLFYSISNSFHYYSNIILSDLTSGFFLLNFRLLLCIIKVVSEVSISLQLFVSSMHFLNLSELPFGDFILCSFFTKNSGSHLHKMTNKCTYSQKQYSIKSNDVIMRFTNLLLEKCKTEFFVSKGNTVSTYFNYFYNFSSKNFFANLYLYFHLRSKSSSNY